MSNREIIKEYTLDTLSSENFKFRIPLYQRAYAWTSDEVKVLIEDLVTAKEKGLSEYFIGNIVVEKRNDDIFDIIDGQQRFTTLFLISKILNTKYYDLIYEIREEDNIFLQEFSKTNYINFDKADIQFRENIESILNIINTENLKLYELLELCKITLTILPEGIDIVKYFEVMNNRGKQLEKHQILKAQLLNAIQPDDEIESTDPIEYDKIWDYCSNMNVYIEDSVYYGTLRKDEKNYDENVRKPLLKFLKESNNVPYFFKLSKNKKIKSTIADIIMPSKNDNEPNKYKDEFYIRKEYGSIVRFPIFLIQVLKIYLVNSTLENKKKITNLIVNERYLIDYFKNENGLLFNKEQSKDFIIFLLKMRILYDYFIFKRDENDIPSINSEKNIYSDIIENKNILMLQLLFNFTSPQFITQDWLSVTLQWLEKNINNFENEDFFKSYHTFLEKFDKELARIRISQNIKIIDFINSKLQNEEINFPTKLSLSTKLNQGTQTPHYWFYKLDYLLWKEEKIWEENFEAPFENLDYKNIKINFRLSRLNSIEHIHPQSKKNEWNKNVDDFGNLALISNHMNSALNAQQVIDKRLDIKKQINNNTLESLKMIYAYSKNRSWDENSSIIHEKEMLEILEKDLNE